MQTVHAVFTSGWATPAALAVLVVLLAVAGAARRLGAVVVPGVLDLPELRSASVAGVSGELGRLHAEGPLTAPDQAAGL